ncbi:MAG: hypothetical protein DHS80DRAFT_31600 [Piptocephalis tieghemiana]|nr:MAG: hypothetical protein DHS80DRAFT_31600 [Piptocephalis tieghemiana]
MHFSTLFLSQLALFSLLDQSSWALEQHPPAAANTFPLLAINDTIEETLHVSLDQILVYNGQAWVQSSEASPLLPQDWTYVTYPVPIDIKPNTLNQITSLTSQRLLTLSRPETVTLTAAPGPQGSIQAWNLRPMTIEIKGHRSYVYQIEDPGTGNCLTSNALQGAKYLDEAPLVMRPCKAHPDVVGDINDPSVANGPKTKDNSPPSTLGYNLGDPDASAHFQAYLKTLWLITVGDFGINQLPPDGPAHINGFGDYLNGYYSCLTEQSTLGPCDNDSPSQRFKVTPIQ